LPAEISGKIMLGLSDLPNKEDLLFEMENILKQKQAEAQAMQQAQIEAMANGQSV
jgi:hypothetical protein